MKSESWGCHGSPGMSVLLASHLSLYKTTIIPNRKTGTSSGTMELCTGSLSYTKTSRPLHFELLYFGKLDLLNLPSLSSASELISSCQIFFLLKSILFASLISARSRTRWVSMGAWQGHHTAPVCHLCIMAHVIGGPWGRGSALLPPSHAVHKKLMNSAAKHVGFLTTSPCPLPFPLLSLSMFWRALRSHSPTPVNWDCEINIG